MQSDVRIGPAEIEPQQYPSPLGLLSMYHFNLIRFSIAVLGPSNYTRRHWRVKTVLNERRYVGIDLNPEYIKLAQGRIDAALGKMSLFNN